MRYLVLVFLLSSCGEIEHEITGLDKGNMNITGTIGPDYIGANKVCNDRYGKYTEESNDCFEEYHKAMTLKVGLDLDGIVDYCEKRHTDTTDIYNCEDRLFAILESASNV